MEGWIRGNGLLQRRRCRLCGSLTKGWAEWDAGRMVYIKETFLPGQLCRLLVRQAEDVLR